MDLSEVSVDMVTKLDDDVLLRPLDYTIRTNLSSKKFIKVHHHSYFVTELLSLLRLCENNTNYDPLVVKLEIVMQRPLREGYLF